VTPLALCLYAVFLVVAGLAVWRRPVHALYLFIVGLALHNLVMALLYGAGLRGGPLDAIQAWKEILLAVAVARVVFDAVRARAVPFRPGLVDGLALAFAAIVVLYAVLPQQSLGGDAGPKAILYGLRHALVPVVAYLLGRSLRLTVGDLRRLGWTLLGSAAVLAAGGLIEEYTVPVEWWRDSGAVGSFTRELGFVYHGPGNLPDNFAFNTSDGVFRRLISSFISPLGTAFALVVALLLAGVAWQTRRLRPLVAALVAVSAAGLLWTLSRSSIVALAVGLAVLAVALRRPWPLGAAILVLAAGVGFAFAFTDVAPRTHFFKADLDYQQQQAALKGPLPEGSSLALNPGEASLRSHWLNLRDGLETVGRHPQGYGLGNAGATAARFDVPLQAGESNYTETGVETGLLGMLLLIAWNVALLVGLVRAAWSAEEQILRQATAGLAAALAAVLALAIQTDIYGVPWIAYTVWWLGGSLLDPAAVPYPTTAPRAARAVAERA
jgi:O-Antigen ligase